MAVKIVAEMCCNHQGDIEIAFKMANAAIEAGANFIKFQKWHPSTSLTKEAFHDSHPVPHNSFGASYGQHRENLELEISEHIALKEHIHSNGAAYSVSVFDLLSAKQIVELNPDYIKIPSQRNLNRKLLEFLAKEFSGEIHCSTGMTTAKEIEEIFKLFSDFGRAQDLVIYHCTSSYPCAFTDLNLLGISQLKKKFGDQIKCVGFSGHHNGIAPDPVAVALGAQYVERHFTLSRAMKGTDHAASLEPQGFKKLVRDIRNIEDALTMRSEGILDSELHARSYQKYLPEWDN